MLSHKKYKELVEGFKVHVQDDETLQHLLVCVKKVTGYSEDKSNYSRSAYEKLKERRLARGETSWTDARKQYYYTHKEELNQKRNLYLKKQREAAKSKK